MKRFFKNALVLLVILVLIVFIAPFFIPVPPLENTHPPRDLADTESQFININGLEVHLKTLGEGQPTFMLLHGFGANLYSWRQVMEPLSQYGKVIAYDRPGFGLTERPLEWQGQNPYSAEAQTSLVLGLMDYYGIQQAILVGNSAGGAISMQVALSNPERVKALILVDPAVYTNVVIPSWLQPVLATPQMDHLGPLLVRRIQSGGLDLLQKAWHNPDQISEETLGDYTVALRAENWDTALWEVTRAYQESNLNEKLGNFSLPIMIITGDDDRIIPTEDSVRLAKELPGATLTIIKDAGHVPHEEKPTAFMEAVQSFLKTLNLTN